MAITLHLCTERAITPHPTPPTPMLPHPALQQTVTQQITAGPGFQLPSAIRGNEEVLPTPNPARVSDPTLSTKSSSVWV